MEVSWLKNQDAMDIFGDVAIILNVNIKVSWASIAFIKELRERHHTVVL